MYFNKSIKYVSTKDRLRPINTKVSNQFVTRAESDKSIILSGWAMRAIKCNKKYHTWVGRWTDRQIFCPSCGWALDRQQPGQPAPFCRPWGIVVHLVGP